METRTSESYSLDPPESLIAKGTQGIASWSKALCIRNPNRYAIYDARVAVSLNCLQIAKAVHHPSRFPLLSGQNKVINQGSKKVAQYAAIHRWPALEQGVFYEDYNSLLSIAAKRLDVKPYTLEMLLFAKALELLREAFPKEDFQQQKVVTIVREPFATDRKVLSAKIARIRQAAGADADITIEENKNGGVVIRIQLYNKA